MMSRHRRNPRAAFTLIELLVAIGLMIILMGAVALIFFQSTDLFKTSEARMQIANNARTALDMLARDLAGSLPTDSKAQCFTMWNTPGSNGGVPTGNGQVISGANSFGAADALQFWATTSFRGTVSGVHITYYVDSSSDPEIMNNQGTATGVRTGRRLMVLRRIARRRNGNVWNTPNETDEADLCEYVLSFNVEPLLDPDDAGPEAARFVNLDEPAPIFRPAPNFAPPGNPYNAPGLNFWNLCNPHPNTNPTGTIPPTRPVGDPVLQTSLSTLYPIGCDTPPRATPNNIKPPMAIRITMRIVEGGAEKQERLISRVIWIPIQ